MHEASLYEFNIFITLTYDKKHLPGDYSVDVKHWQDFMKRYRFSLNDPGHKLRFYMCGEYGEKNLRPHYHAIIFNHDFADKVIYEVNERGDKLYTSPSLSKLWPCGLATIGDVTFESAAYVARYCTKKITGENAGAHYLRQHPDTGFWHQVRPEFSTSSRGGRGTGLGGIASTWIQKFKSDVYPSDFIVARNMQMSPPRFYDNKLPEEELAALKRRRRAQGVKQKANQTPARLRARATVRDARMQTVKRNKL